MPRRLTRKELEAIGYYVPRRRMLVESASCYNDWDAGFAFVAWVRYHSCPSGRPALISSQWEIDSLLKGKTSWVLVTARIVDASALADREGKITIPNFVELLALDLGEDSEIEIFGHVGSPVLK